MFTQCTQCFPTRWALYILDYSRIHIQFASLGYAVEASCTAVKERVWWRLALQSNNRNKQTGGKFMQKQARVRLAPFYLTTGGTKKKQKNLSRLFGGRRGQPRLSENCFFSFFFLPPPPQTQPPYPLVHQPSPLYFFKSPAHNPKYLRISPSIEKQKAGEYHRLHEKTSKYRQNRIATGFHSVIFYCLFFRGFASQLKIPGPNSPPGLLKCIQSQFKTIQPQFKIKEKGNMFNVRHFFIARVYNCIWRACKGVPFADLFFAIF